MEFANFVVIFITGVLVVRRPEREGLAFGLLVASAIVMAGVFLLGTRTAILPPFTY